MSFGYVIRPMTEADHGFVINSWMESHHGGWRRGHVRWSEYAPEMRALIAALIEKHTVLVACLEDEPDHLLGWVCAEELHGVPSGAVLHYVYVRQKRRLCGLANALVADIEKQFGRARYYTHKTHAALRVLGHRRDRNEETPRFNPALLPKPASMSENRKAV